ncbi:MAG: hypothetical protein WA927_15855, partial [Rhodococcus sp. (in: high G+C Gram-positive bacteria)]
MASLYKKIINGKPYFYLREMARVDGKPKMVSERYLGSAADIVAAMDRAEAGMIPERTRHLAFGDIAAVWSLLTDLDVAAVIDEVVGARRSDAGASIGTYLAMAALGRLVAPRSKKAFADWWASTAGDRFTKISPPRSWQRGEGLNNGCLNAAHCNREPCRILVRGDSWRPSTTNPVDSAPWGGVVRIGEPS